MGTSFLNKIQRYECVMVIHGEFVKNAKLLHKLNILRKKQTHQTLTVNKVIMNPNAHERSTEYTHTLNPNQKRYDWAYYNALLPYITGNVLDIGAGAGMFVKEYSKKDEVNTVTCLDKYTEELPAIDKVIRIDWVCPEPLPTGMVYDTIVSTEFVEHIERDQFEPLLEQIVKAMKEDSVFVGSTPNKQVPTTNPYHLYEYTLPEITEIFEQYFSEVKTWDTNVDFCTVWVCKK